MKKIRNIKSSMDGMYQENNVLISNEYEIKRQRLLKP